MEIKLNLKLVQGQMFYESEKIDGELNSIIIDSDNKCEVIIESDLGYLIFHRREHEGVNYYAVRTRTTTPKEDLKDYPTFDKFKLNEKILITLIGRKNSEISLILRFDKKSETDSIYIP